MNDRQRQHNHSVRRIVLPSGRSIEVVRFHEPDQAVHQLHVCPDCDCELVQPLAWSEAAEDRWELTLECPNCRWSTDGMFTEDQVNELEDRLDEGLADLLGDLRRLAHASSRRSSGTSSSPKISKLRRPRRRCRQPAPYE